MNLPVLPASGAEGVPPQVLSALLDEVHRQVKAGLLYTHHRSDRNTDVLRDVAATVYALAAALAEKGVVSPAELETKRRQFAKEVVEQFKKNGMAPIRLIPETDKYTYKSDCKVDCLSRLHICKAVCCQMPFALSKQDVEEGVIQWDLGHPYVIQHGADGFCVHRDAGTCRCTAYEQRPVACRAFDCTDDERIWADFEKMELSEEAKSALASAEAAES